MQLVEFGDPPRFELNDVADPLPGPGEVVVDVMTAALNRRDPWVWTTPGYCPLPVTLGSDGAGIVSAVGAGVTEVGEGDEVVIYPALNWDLGASVPGPDFDILGAPSDGTFAEKVLVNARSVARRPHRLSWEEAGALPLGGLTAWRAVFTCGEVGPGSRVLVTGAGGGVSSFIIQLAVAAGAEVFVTTGNPEKADRALALGARAAVLYRDPTWPEAVLQAAGGSLDTVIDSFGSSVWAAVLPLLRWGGVLVSFGDTGDPSASVQVADVYWNWRSIIGTSMGSPDEFRALLAHVDHAAWRPVVDSTFRLDGLAEAANRLSSPGRFGKVVVRVGGGVR